MSVLANRLLPLPFVVDIHTSIEEDYATLDNHFRVVEATWRGKQIQ